MKELTEKSKRERLFLALDIDPKQFAEYEDTIWLGRSTKELTPEQISQAVVVMTTILNLSSGNSGGRNLYKLNQLYLLNDVATNDLNEVLMKYQAVIFNH